MKKAFSLVKPYIIIFIGLFLSALAWTAFLIPAEITGGGISGVATLIYYASGFPVGISYLIINGFLLIVAFRILGAAFGVKTIIGVGIFSVLLSVLQTLITEPVVDDTFMSAVIGGILSGAGVGIVFTQGGSTGGTDIIAMMVTKYRNISPGKVILYLDIIIISSSYLIFQSIEKVVYGYVTMAIAAYSIDMVLSGAKQSYQVFIFSQKFEEIATRISGEVGRGITLMDAEGWYSRQHTKVLLVIVRKTDLNHVFQIIKQIDPKAFMSVGNVMGVYGLGFDKIKG